MSEIAIPTTREDQEQAEAKGAQTQPGSTPLQHQSFFRKWGGLVVLSLGLAIIIIDSTLLNVSLSTLIQDLHTDLQSLQWVITAYSLILAAFTITGGRFGDLFGRKRMFMVGAGIFAVGSFLASISNRVGTMIIGESVIEGIGAALMMPATASLVVANFKGADRAKAFGIWGGVAGASSAIGPLLGGYLTTHYSWRWGFRINVFVAAVLILGSLLLLAESKDERKPQIDWGGVALSAIGLLGIVFGIIESETYGWWKAKDTFSLFGHQLHLGGLSIVPFAMILGFLFLGLFVWWQKRREAAGKTPLVSLHLFQNSQFTSGSITVAIMTLGMTGLVFALPVWLQSVRQLDAFHTGLALLPMSATILVMAPLTGVLQRKISPKYLIQAGLLVEVCALFLLRTLVRTDATANHLIPGLILFGVGMGMVMAPISNLTLSSVPPREAGEASGVNNTLRQVGSSLGAAIIGAAVLTSLVSGLSRGVQNSPVLPDQAKPGIIKSVSDPQNNVEFGSSGVAPQNTPPVISQEIGELAKQASTNAAKDGFIYAALFIFLGLIASFYLPVTDIHAHGHEQEPQLDAAPHSRLKIASSALLAAIGIAGAVLLLQKSSKATIATGLSNTALAGSPTGQSQVNLIPDNPAPAGAVTSTTTPSTATIPEAAPQQGPQPDTRTASPTAPSTAEVYQDPSAGFELLLSPDWQASSQGSTVVLTSRTGQRASVEVFPYPDGTIETVATQLAGSPSVTASSAGSFQSDPAINFSTAAGQHGMAILHNGKIYYLMANDIQTSPLASLKFL